MGLKFHKYNYQGRFPHFGNPCVWKIRSKKFLLVYLAAKMKLYIRVVLSFGV